VILASEPLIRWGWIADHTDEIWERTVQHVRLTFFAVLIGFVISLALALVALRFRRVYPVITWTTGLLYTVPSIALMGALIPVVGLGERNVLIALVTYTLLILVRNIVAGIDGVPAPVRDAAQGMGYPPWRRFLEVELRLATPAIISGLRIATVTVIGLITIGSLVGAGGYGVFINDGFDRQFTTPMLLGAGLSVALALVTEAFFVTVQRVLTPWTRR
jgi:osmoprotectant transport system permease protein